MAFECCICDKQFSSQSNLNKHKVKVHGFKSAISSKFMCMEGCQTAFRYNSELRNHLKQDHDIQMEQESVSFSTFAEFESWLSCEEKERDVQYSRGSTSKMRDSEHIYYECVRSCKGTGSSVMLETRKRNIKSQGSCKMPVSCTSQIIVRRNKTSGETSATYFKTHYNHKNELQHLRLHKKDRQAVASKLILGVTPSVILDEVKESVAGDLQRIDLLTSKDVTNIKSSFKIGIKDGHYHENDATSVDIWVKKCLSASDNPVLFYKQQGFLYENGSLSAQDFCLIIMSSIQEDMLRKFGEKVVAVDSTHGLNSYDFELTTLLVIDEYGEGFPVAFMFCNRKDSHIFEIFFSKIRDRVGVINTSVFMTDMTNVFYMGWCKAMGLSAKHLFCSWHVDRAWQMNLGKISNLDKRKFVYQALKYLQQELDENEFQVSLDNFLDMLRQEESTCRFWQYFTENYVGIVHKWAYCFRKNSGVNTNMKLENLHKVLKYHFCRGKKIKRLDGSIHALLNFARHKRIGRIIKLTKGKHNYHLATIGSRHRRAMVSKFECEVRASNQWVVTSSSDHSYIVTKDEDLRRPCCPLKCCPCNICIHMYQCTCVDYAIRTILCKHIHYVCNKVNVQQMPEIINNGVAELPSSELLERRSEVASLTGPSCHKKTVEKEVEQDLLVLLNNLKSKTYTPEQLSLIHKNVKAALAVGSVKIPTTFQVVPGCSREPSNKRIVKQGFFSTKKKRKCNPASLSCPTNEEIVGIKETISRGLFVSADPAIDHNYN